MSEQGAGGPPPGWYDDPERPGHRRWWDGTAWTDRSEPIAPASGPPPAPSGPPPGAGQPPGTGQPTFVTAGAGSAAPSIDTWLWQSIVATLLCCLPLGIVAIVFSSQAQTEINNGNYGAARDKAGTAKTFTLISAALGVLFWVGWIVLFTAGMAPLFFM